MLQKTINVSGALKTANDMYINVSFNYRNNPSELNNIDFNFNKNEVNVFGTYNIRAGKITNYSVNNGVIEPAVLDEVAELAATVAADPENEDFYAPDSNPVVLK